VSIISQIKQPSELRPYLNADVYQEFEPESIIRDQVDLHLVCVDDFGQVQARCSLWWTDVPELENEKLGVIGHFAVDSDLSDHDTAIQVMLNNACFLLKIQRCTRVMGPMDGNTMRNYSFVTDAGSEPRFFLEPNNPLSWPKYWLDYDFSPIAEYHSELITDLTSGDERLAKMEARFANKVSLRSLELDKFEQELRRISSIKPDHYLPSPKNEDDFVNYYKPLKEFMQAGLTLIAEQDGVPVGYLIAIPDINEKTRDEQIKTIIIKTVVVSAGNEHASLETLLVDKVLQQARVMGFERAIYALMPDQKDSPISGYEHNTLRRYTLFSKSFR